MLEEKRTDQAPKRFSITDAIVLAALSAFAYVFHYFFEFGYLSYFDIPTAFISFNLSEMIPAVLFLVAAYIIFVFVLWPYINALLMILPRFVKTILIFIPWLIIFVFLGFSWVWILLIFFGILLIFGIESLRDSRGRTSVGKTSAANSNPSTFATANALDTWVEQIIPNGSRFLLMYLLFSALLGSMAFGKIAAMTRSNFLVSDTSPRCAIVYTTTDRYICKPYDQNNAFENSFHVFYFQETQNIEFRNETIGPLRPKLPPMPTP